MAQGKRAKKIVLIEEDANLLGIYRSRLEKEGHQVFCLRDSRQALKAIPTLKPQVIICEIMMSKLSGLSLLKLLKKSRKLAKTKIIITTSITNHKYRRQAKRIGVHKYFVKSKTKLADVLTSVKQVTS